MTVTVECPRCSYEVDVEVEVSGSYRAARGPSYHSGGEPAEYPEVEYVTPSCEFCGPLLQSETDTLEREIEEAALELYADTAFDPKWDGPEGDE